MKIDTEKFNNVLSNITTAAKNYIYYSPSQIARGDHLKNDPMLGEHAWNIPETTGRFLYNLITKLTSVTGLELGTSTGYSTFWIASALEENSPESNLITIEQNKRKSDLAIRLLNPIFGNNITFQNNSIKHVLSTIPTTTKFDFIFMDADRGNYKDYWNYLQNFLHETSIVVIDNALREQKSVREFQDYLINNPALSTHLYELDNGLFIVTKSDGVYSDIQEIIATLLKETK